MKLRIGSGKFKNRYINTPDDSATRPSTAYSKKVIFDTLQSHLLASKVLDLFAGSGALGIEAISKGAHFATFVDKESRPAKIISENIETLDIENECTVIRKDVLGFIESTSITGIDIIFMDPPYSMKIDSVLQILKLINEKDILDTKGLICLEMPSKSKDELIQHLDISIFKEKIKGETALLFFTFND
ncbi:MAG: Ribosomal RNA small subunit methyltransferase D [Chlamydiia bacterium]|nr:Ribosomal RNA small subunit methyltransferase D [Chlamydiia bacterium]